MSAPLGDVRVLDLSRVLAGPYCTMLLADLGADVIKVESPEGDETRGFGPPFVGGESTYFLSINRGKRSLVVDLKHGRGRGLVQDLARWADVVVENFRPGSADKLGVGYQALSRVNPRLIYASISGYGLSGAAPYTSLPGYDLVVQGVGGIASLTGPADGAPHKMGTSVADLVSGLNALAGILAALHARSTSGRGTHLDISMLEGQLSMLTYHASAWLNAGKRPQRLGNAHPSICPYETFRAADGWLNIACGNDAQFAALGAALGRSAWATDPRFASNAKRVENRAALLSVLAPLLAEKPLAEWLERIGAAGVPCGPILEVPEALSHPQAAARGIVLTHSHAAVGEVRSVGSPLGLGTQATRPPPRLGEHTDEVLREVLGRDSNAIAMLRNEGVIR